MPYSVTQAAQLHLVKCLAVTEGPKIRVNTILPGLLLTEWGKKYSPERIEAIRAWGRERAVPASGAPIGARSDATSVRRAVLLG